MYCFQFFDFQKTLNNLYLFVPANEFPSSFESIVRKILRLLFHVVAHLYHCHFREVLLLNLHAHLNCVFVHLTLFNERFRLIEPRETEILDDLVVALKILVTEPSETEQVGLDETIDIQQTNEHSMKNNWVFSPSPLSSWRKAIPCPSQPVCICLLSRKHNTLCQAYTSSAVLLTACHVTLIVQ